MYTDIVALSLTGEEAFAVHTALMARWEAAREDSTLPGVKGDIARRRRVVLSAVLSRMEAEFRAQESPTLQQVFGS